MKSLSREEREIDFNEAYSYAYKFILDFCQLDLTD